MHTKQLFAVILCVVFLGCNQKEVNKNSLLNQKFDTQTSVEVVENLPLDVGRSIWQKPGIILDKLGDLDGKIIADIGAGKGYFAFRLALKAEKVIAIDINQKYLNYIDSVTQHIHPNLKERIETRLTETSENALNDQEADCIIIINTIAYLPDLSTYLSNLKSKLKLGGTLMVVDYKMKKLPINAPPKSERIYLDRLEDILEANGFKSIKTDDTSLDYQYIITAQI